MTHNEQTAVEALISISRVENSVESDSKRVDFCVRVARRTLALLEASPTVPVSMDLRKLWEAGVYHGYGHAMRAAIPRDKDRDDEAFKLAMQEAVPESKWMLMSDGLPELEEMVFTYWHDPRFPGSEEGLGRNRIVKTEDGKIVWEGYEEMECGITHWMPMTGATYPRVPQ